MADDAVLRICDAIHDPERRRGMARDIVAHLQCFSRDGKPTFTEDQIQRIVDAVGQIALRCAEEGDDRGLARMLAAQLKLAAVAEKLREHNDATEEADGILARLRDRQRAAEAG